MIGSVLDWIFGIFVCLFALFLGFILFVFMPVLMKTEADCLRAGYPKYSVSIGLERYCMNMQGAVTVVVVPAK